MSLTLLFQNNAIPNLRYFGFVGIDSGVTDSIHPDTTNYLAETSAWTNIAHLTVGDTGSIAARIAAMNAVGVKPVVDVSLLLYSGSPLTLRGTYASDWATFVANNPGISPANTAALYVADEPFLRLCTYSDLNTGVNLVKASYPTIPTLVIEAYTALAAMNLAGVTPVGAQTGVPPKLDWYGFDLYQNDPTGGTYLAYLY